MTEKEVRELPLGATVYHKGRPVFVKRIEIDEVAQWIIGATGLMHLAKDLTLTPPKLPLPAPWNFNAAIGAFYDNPYGMGSIGGKTMRTILDNAEAFRAYLPPLAKEERSKHLGFLEGYAIDLSHRGAFIIKNGKYLWHDGALHATAVLGIDLDTEARFDQGYWRTVHDAMHFLQVHLGLVEG